MAVFKSFVVRAAVKALGGESDPSEFLGWQAFVPPDASNFPGRGVAFVAIWGLVGPGATVRASQFHQVRLVGIEGDSGVEPVAAQVHQPSAVGGEFLQRREFVACDVLGVAAGNDYPVVAE